MADVIDWTCPFCQKPVLINPNLSRRQGSVETVSYNSRLDAADGQMTLFVVYTTCPDRNCRRTALGVYLYPLEEQTITGPSGKKTEWQPARAPLKSWSLIPSNTAKAFPGYVPAAIRADYEEACAIRDLSPKASATLARRCLQGMIRDFFGVNVKSQRLADEIDAIQDKVESEVWDAITAVRKVGNIGAHMETDISVVVDVEPDEAAKLLTLIEMLLLEWYVARQARRDALAAVKAVAAAKAAAKVGSADPTGTP